MANLQTLRIPRVDGAKDPIVSEVKALVGPAINTTSDTVAYAFINGDTKPATTDWNAAAWLTDNGHTYGQITIGNGGGANIDLARATYAMWEKLTSGGSITIRQIGTLEVY